MLSFPPSLPALLSCSISDILNWRNVLGCRACLWACLLLEQPFCRCHCSVCSCFASSSWSYPVVWVQNTFGIPGHAEVTLIWSFLLSLDVLALQSGMVPGLPRRAWEWGPGNKGSLGSSYIKGHPILAFACLQIKIIYHRILGLFLRFDLSKQR